MAARKQLWHPDEVKKKIQTSQLINRLTQHALSDEPIMDSSQVTAAVKLINKVVPDLSSVQQETKHGVTDEFAAFLEQIGTHGRKIHD